mgnify:FL=1
MRSEKEILDLIIKVAKEDERIRAAFIGGSRCNPNAPRDIFQDYDVEFIVRETKSFREDKRWIDRFGKRLYMQCPDDNIFYPSEPDNRYAWLIQFADGVRLDLTVCTLEYRLPLLKNDRMYRILIDKDNCIPPLDENRLSDSEFWVKRPTQDEFTAACNEFWWCLNNVAKGLWRDEIPYVMDMINMVIRPQLLKLIEWKIGIQTNFKVSIGKSGKYMHRWLTGETYQRYLDTYSAAERDAIWKSVFVMCDMVDEMAAEIVYSLGFEYNKEEAINSRAYLEHVRNLPKDAKEIY